MTPKTVTIYNGLITVWVIWFDETEDGPSEVRPKVRRKDMIGRDGRWSICSPSKSLSEGYDWTRRKMVCLKSLRRNLVGRKMNLVRMTMRSTCMSCQTDLIGRDGICSYLLETLLIGWSNGSVFWKHLWLADPMDLSSSVFFWLLFTSRFSISYSHSQLTRNNTRMRLLSATNTPFNLPLTRETNIPGILHKPII